jgi:hypothetical protein
MLFNGYGSGCSVICCDGCSYINQVPLNAAACIIIDTHMADETFGRSHRLQSPCPSMCTASYFLACYRRAVGGVIMNLALKGSDGVGLCRNVQLSRFDCTTSCNCEQPVVQLLRGRLLLHVPQDAHVMLVNADSSHTGKNGNVVLIISHLPVRSTHNPPPLRAHALNIACLSPAYISGVRPYQRRKLCSAASRADPARCKRFIRRAAWAA